MQTYLQIKIVYIYLENNNIYSFTSANVPMSKMATSGCNVVVVVVV